MYDGVVWIAQRGRYGCQKKKKIPPEAKHVSDFFLGERRRRTDKSVRSAAAARGRATCYNIRSVVPSTPPPRANATPNVTYFRVLFSRASGVENRKRGNAIIIPEIESTLARAPAFQLSNARHSARPANSRPPAIPTTGRRTHDVFLRTLARAHRGTAKPPRQKRVFISVRIPRAENVLGAK